MDPSSTKTKLKKLFGTSHIGFVVANSDPYNEVMASTRIRCYDVINYLNKRYIFSELYKKSKRYKIVVFQKCFDDRHIELAKKLKSNGTKILFDINVNYVKLENEALDYVKPEQTKKVLTMLELSDEVIAASKKIGEIYEDFHNKVTVIEESIEDNFLKVTKTHTENKPVYLLYCGYAVKAKEILLIKDVLLQLYKEFPFKMLYICDIDPEIDLIPYNFLKYNYPNLPDLLAGGDIKIAPRDLSNSYNWGHAFTKVAYPMAVGIPAVASPVPSYLNREVTICNTPTEWYDNLKRLILSPELRQKKGLAGKKVVKNNFTIDVIGPQYIKLFQKYL